MSVDEFKSHDTDFFKKGLRLADLSIRGDSVAAVWRAGSGEQHWRTGMSVDEFKAQDTGLFNKGLRLADLEIYNGKYAAVWRAGNGAQHWRSGMSADQLENEDSTQFAKGMRLLDVEAYDGDKFTAVWHSGTGEQHWRTGMSLDEFKAQDAKFFFQSGLRLVELELRDGLFSTGFAAVWTPGTGEQHWWSGTSVSELEAKDAEFFSKGLRLQVLDMSSEVV